MQKVVSGVWDDSKRFAVSSFTIWFAFKSMKVWDGLGLDAIENALHETGSTAGEQDEVGSTPLRRILR